MLRRAVAGIGLVATADGCAVVIGAFLAKHRAIESGRELTDTGEIARLWG